MTRVRAKTENETERTHDIFGNVIRPDFARDDGRVSQSCACGVQPVAKVVLLPQRTDFVLELDPQFVKSREVIHMLHYRSALRGLERA